MNADVIESIIETHLSAASKGDQLAYSRIVRGCQNTVTSIALAIVRDVPASEDIAQDAFISAWQQLKKLHHASSFLPWLRQITRNLARDYLRGQKYRANPAGDIEAMMLSVADPAPHTAAVPARMIFEWIGVTLGIAIAIGVLLWGLNK